MPREPSALLAPFPGKEKKNGRAGEGREKPGCRLSSFPPKLGGKLRFAQTAVMHRFGKASLKPTNSLMAAGRGQFSTEAKRSLRWRGEEFPTISLGLIIDSKVADAPNHVRVYSDATGAGGLASLAFPFLPGLPAPILVVGRSQGVVRELSSFNNKIYIFDQYAAGLWRTKVKLFADNERRSGGQVGTPDRFCDVAVDSCAL